MIKKTIESCLEKEVAKETNQEKNKATYAAILQKESPIILIPKETTTKENSRKTLESNKCPESIKIETMSISQKGEIRLQTTSNANEAAELLAKTDLNDKYTMKVLGPKIAKIIVFAVRKEITDEEITSKLMEESGTAGTVMLKKTMRSRIENTRHLVFTLPATVAEKLMKKKRVYINYTSLLIRKYQPIVRCRKCQNFNHDERTCTNFDRCEFCSEKHPTASCTMDLNEQNQRCINCLRYNNENKNNPSKLRVPQGHGAGSARCQTYHAYLKFIRTLPQQVHPGRRT